MARIWPNLDASQRLLSIPGALDNLTQPTVPGQPGPQDRHQEGPTSLTGLLMDGSTRGRVLRTTSHNSPYLANPGPKIHIISLFIFIYESTGDQWPETGVLDASLAILSIPFVASTF